MWVAFKRAKSILSICIKGVLFFPTRLGCSTILEIHCILLSGLPIRDQILCTFVNTLSPSRNEFILSVPLYMNEIQLGFNLVFALILSTITSFITWTYVRYIWTWTYGRWGFVKFHFFRLQKTRSVFSFNYSSTREAYRG